MEGRSEQNPKPGLVNDIWSSVFELLSAYDLASLYFTGAKHIQDTLSKRATRFDLHYDPYRRIAWPRNFLPLLPALQHVSIGGHDDQSYPRVPDADVSQLPRGLLTLELHIANGLLSLVNPLKTKALGNRSIPLIPFDVMFPALQHLDWKSLLLDPQNNLTFLDFDTLPRSGLRSLKLSIPTFALDEFSKFPTTLEELSIDAASWLSHRAGKETRTEIPSQITRLELFHVSTTLRVSVWPPNLSHLHIDFDAYLNWAVRLPLAEEYIDWSIQAQLETGPLPLSLTSFFLNAPMLSLGANLCDALPIGLHDLRIYANSLPNEHTARFNTKIASLVQLKTLHCCLSQHLPSSEALFYDNMPPSLAEFVVSTDKKARKTWEVEKMPKSLRTLCSTPITCFGIQPTLMTRPSLDTSDLPLDVPQCFPRSLLELEDSIINHRSFPPTLTRLSLQNLSHSGTAEKWDWTTFRLPPLITDLTLCCYLAFDVLKYCVSLPLVTLYIDLDPNLMFPSEVEAGTAFDLGCFTRLKTLTFNPSYLLPTQCTAWLERLPLSLTELSLVPARAQWPSNIPLHYYLESWIVFPLLPRGLRKFAACISDLHVQEVFAMLPDGLTELYLHGLLLAGAFGQSELRLESPNPYANEPILLDCLPLSLRKLMLPSQAFQSTPLQSFFVSRPQLSDTSAWMPRSMQPSEGAFALPTNLTLRTLLVANRDPSFVLETLTLSMQHQSLATGTEASNFHCADTAIRSPSTNVTELELALMQRAISKLQQGGQSLEDVHKWLFSKRAKLKSQMQKEDDSKKGENCVVS